MIITNYLHNTSKARKREKIKQPDKTVFYCLKLNKHLHSIEQAFRYTEVDF